MKTNQRLGYQRLAEELVDRDLIDREAAREILQQCMADGTGFPAALVESDLVTDWELSRIVCELYNLPFLTVELATPALGAIEGLDPFFLIQHQIVPLFRHGQVLTVLLPAIVPAEVLRQLSSDSGMVVIPIVGTVRTNQAWITKHLVEQTEVPIAMDPQWSALFDDADAAVLNDLGPDPGSSLSFDTDALDDQAA